MKQSLRAMGAASLFIATTLAALLVLAAAPAFAGSTHDYLYMIDPISGNLRTLDTENNQLGPILEGFLSPGAIAAAPGGDYVFVADKRGVNIIATSGTSLQGQIIGTENLTVSDLEVSGDAKQLFVADAKHPVVYVYAIDGFEPLFLLNLTSAAQQLEISPDGSRLYVSTGSRLEAYDLTTGGKSGEAGFSAVSWIALDANGTYLYVVEGKPGQSKSPVHALKASDLSEEWTVEAGPYAQCIALTPDGKLAVTANHDDLSATVIDLREKEVAGTTYTSIYPHRVVAASDSKNVYLSTDTGTLTKISTSPGFSAQKVVADFGIDNMVMARVGSQVYTPPATPTPEPATPTPEPVTPTPTVEPATPTPVVDASNITATPTEAPATPTPSASSSTQSAKNSGCFGMLLPLVGAVVAIGPVAGIIRRKGRK